MKIKTIRTKKGYDEALAAIERLMGARSNTSDGQRLEVLIALVQAYEARHFLPPIEHAATFLKRRAGEAQPSDLLRFLGGALAPASRDLNVLRPVKKPARR